MKSWISLPRVEGADPRQAHCDLPEGTYERELGREGFFGPAAQMLHRHPPTGWQSFEGPMRPRLFDLNKHGTAAGMPWEAQAVLGNAHVKMRYWRTNGAMPALARNAEGDELLFIHEGSGRLFCDYGHMEIRDGDYVVLPRSTMWRTEFDGDAEVMLVEATNDAYRLPEKGPVGRHAIFDPAVLAVPKLDDAFRAQQDENAWEVQVKHRGEISRITYPYNPLDAVGWQGDLAPVRLNWRDIRPLMSHRAHLPPSAHTTFLASRFVVCTFVPRPFESDPGALKVPFFHNNDDYDEVLFYHRGDFFSRDNIDRGMVTFHPCGFTHGPHPKALKNAFEQSKPATDEVAMMIDTRDPLEVAALPGGIEVEDYARSWQGKPGA
ncbi:MAG: homogentisate 1,2-dioxygenase [Alphaproteobacteria bacterium]|nr:homogentisate 1,2-dioxygenase [Alphaproteobacteria bacterium]